MLSEWNIFVKKVYHEGKAKNRDYQFKQALKDASRRKSEMSKSGVKSKKRHFKRSKSRKMAGGTRRRQSRRR